jgi:hypothetical protein
MLTAKPLLTGKRFRLKAETVAVVNSHAKRIAATILAGELIEVKVAPFPTNIRMVGIRWKGQALVMFAEDIEARGEEVISQGANAAAVSS